MPLDKRLRQHYQCSGTTASGVAQGATATYFGLASSFKVPTATAARDDIGHSGATMFAGGATA